jgi:luciferase family oxidoreductase group 1
MVPQTAVALDRFGYHRYWLSEHHGRGALSASPLILSTVVAGITTRLRTGPAGVLLHYHSPLKVAEDMRMLELLFPGRIDLGIARAVERNQVVGKALLDGRSGIRDYVDKVRELLRYVRATTTPEDQEHVPPVVDTAPQVWLLGTSVESAMVAASLGARYSFSRAINNNPSVAQEACRVYRESFQSTEGGEAYCSIALSFVCAATEEEARAQKSPAVLSANILGDEETLFEAITEIEHDSGVDEIVLVDVAERLEAKIASYERIAVRFGLTQQLAAPASAT